MNILMLIVALALVTLGAELLVRGAGRLALRLGVSSLVVGLTVVGFGTSSPELGASVTASLQDRPGIAVGNTIGSNTFNLLVILGLAALIKPVRLAFKPIAPEVGWTVAVAFVPLLALLPFAAPGEGVLIGPLLGVPMLAGLATYLVVSYLRGRRGTEQNAPADPPAEPIATVGTPEPRGAKEVVIDVVLVVAGLALLVVGSSQFVDRAATLARGLGVSELVIGLTIVAAGTSLPELVTSAVAAKKGQPELAVGNVLGSNVFNILGILGVASLVTPQTVSRDAVAVDTPVMIGASLLIAGVLAWKNALPRWSGALCLVLYAGYLTHLLLRGG